MSSDRQKPLARDADSSVLESASQPVVLSLPLLEKERLNADRIHEHGRRIGQAVREGRETWIPIVSACTSNNGGIIPWKTAVRFLEGEKSQSERSFDTSLLEWWTSHYVLACIPAAGAASRYLAQLHRFATEVESQVAGLSDLFETAATMPKPTPAATLPALNPRERSVFVSGLEGLAPSADFLRLAEHVRSLRAGEIREIYRSTIGALVSFLTVGQLPETKVEKALKSGTASDSHDGESFIGQGDAWKLRRPWRRTMRALRSQSMHESMPAAGVGPRMVASHLSVAAHQTLDAYVAAKLTLRSYGGAPKAFVPTTEEGDTFLGLKLIEQATLLPCLGNFLIAPADMQERFEAEIAREGERLRDLYVNPFELAGSPFGPRYLNEEERHKRGVWNVVEQGRDLCTIRFLPSGEPFTNEDGSYSVVSAGHGELLHLFRGMAEAFPQAECIHVRNIDNIIGTTGERCEELSVPADMFRIVRDCLEFVRAVVDDFLSTGRHVEKDARLVSTNLLEIVDYLVTLGGALSRAARPEEAIDASGRFVGFRPRGLHTMFRSLFHWPEVAATASDAEVWLELQKRLAFPLSVFGVVRKETGDVGGGPVFVDMGDGTQVKICLEMPHASPSDSAEFFGPRGRATHFNPVLVFFELRTHKRSFEGNQGPGRAVDFGQLFDDRFWLLSKKEHQGTAVCYHETVLYELIGNSATTNLLFVEVPRTLFVPHKTVFDSMGQDRRSYGFHETLKDLERTP